jgi:hypothetical protein
MLKDDPELKKELFAAVIKSIEQDPKRVQDNCQHDKTYVVPYGKGSSTICETCGYVMIRDSGVKQLLD